MNKLTQIKDFSSVYWAVKTLPAKSALHPSGVANTSTAALARVGTAMSTLRSAGQEGFQEGISVCNQPTRSTQPCIPPGSLNRVPATFPRVRVGMSALPGGSKQWAIPYGMWVPIAVRLAANSYSSVRLLTYLLISPPAPRRRGSLYFSDVLFLYIFSDFSQTN